MSPGWEPRGAVVWDQEGYRRGRVYIGGGGAKAEGPRFQ